MRKFEQAQDSLSYISDNVSKILVIILRLTETQIPIAQSTAYEGLSRDNTTQQLCNSIKEMINETCQPKIEKEATKIKESFINIWD